MLAPIMVELDHGSYTASVARLSADVISLALDGVVLCFAVAYLKQELADGTLFTASRGKKPAPARHTLHRAAAHKRRRQLCDFRRVRRRSSWRLRQRFGNHRRHSAHSQLARIQLWRGA